MAGSLVDQGQVPTRNALVAFVIAAIVGVVAWDATGGAVVYAPGALVNDFITSGPSIPAQFLYIAVAAIPVTVLHELGHAVVAQRLLGGEVTMTIGSAVRLADIRLGQMRMSLNAVSSPTRVGGLATFDASRARARDVVLIALAGPGASALGLALTIAAFGAAPGHGPLHDFLWASTAAGTFAVLNLIPLELQERRGGPRVRTDGRLALDATRVIRELRDR